MSSPLSSTAGLPSHLLPAILGSGRLGTQCALAPHRVTWVNGGGSGLTQEFQTRATSWRGQLTSRCSHLSPTLPCRNLDDKSHKPLPLGVENDRVFSDLWGKGNVPVVLNNPYSETEQVSGWCQQGGRRGRGHLSWGVDFSFGVFCFPGELTISQVLILLLC